MAQDKVQLKREEIVGNDVVMQDINPNTNTASVTDSVKGMPLDQTLAMIKNMINNELSRIVNSVNGRSGVVIIDANDVGLGNVDNVSFGDIKKWVINQLEDMFGTKRLILKEWLTEIDTIVASNDKAYANAPFFAEKGNELANDMMSYIGYIYWDSDENMLRKQVMEVRVIGYTDTSVIYNTNAGNGRNFSNGGLGVNIWREEDALKIKNNVVGRNLSSEVLNNGGLYIDKTKIVPEVYFFDGVYGTLVGSGASMHNENALVYWSNNPSDTTAGTLPIIRIRINGVDVQTYSSSGSRPDTLHTEQTLKVGDIILTNFSYDQYQDPDAVKLHALYYKMIDSLTCRQPAIGRVIQAADVDTNTPCIVNFFPCKPNASHGLKLIETDSYDAGPTDTTIGIDELKVVPTMSDDTPIYNRATNLSGLNVLDKHNRNDTAYGEPYDKTLVTVFPTGRSNNLLTDTDKHVEDESMFVLPNMSLCVIPGYEFTEVGQSGGAISETRPIVNWNASSPFNGSSISKAVDRFNWNMLGINLEKKMFGGDHIYARNISGLRVNYDTDTLQESWFGFGPNGETPSYFTHSGGLSVNVGQFLEIGTPEELEDPNHSTVAEFYEEGKVNVRIDRSKGLYDSGTNTLGINIAEGNVYNAEGETSVTWKEGGLHFVDAGESNPGHNLLAVNTGRNGSGLSIRNLYNVGVTYERYGNDKHTIYSDNVTAVQPHRFESTFYNANDSSAIEVHNKLISEDLAPLIPMKNLYTATVWKSEYDMHREYAEYPSHFTTDTIYIAGGEYYVFNTYNGSDAFKPYFVFYSDSTEYANILTCLNTGVIDPEIADDVASSIGFLRSQCHVLVSLDPFATDKYIVRANIYEPCLTNEDDLHFPDLDGNGLVDATESSEILDIWSMLFAAEEVYASAQDPSDLYTDPEKSNPLIPEVGHYYIAVNDKTTSDGHDYCSIWVGTGTTHSSVARPTFGGHSLTNTDIRNADIDRDGYIDAVDASLVCEFYSNLSTKKYGDVDIKEAWTLFLRERLGINVQIHSTPEGAVEIFKNEYIKGIRVRYNEFKGLTTSTEYIGSGTRDSETLELNDIKNSLSIKIADPSAGMLEFDETKCGGLRFTTGGYLGVRINNNNNFNSVIPTKRTQFNYDQMNTGTRGLRLYGTNDSFNVLGVQLTPDGKLDNGELKIDAEGCLRLSSEINVDIKTLTFSGQLADGTPETVEYDGGDDVTISLGPGLCFEVS